MQFQIKHLTAADTSLFQQLTNLFASVFETHTPAPPAAYLHSLLARPGFIAIVAMAADEVVAGLTAYELPMYSAEGAEVFIYDVAVLPAYQRKSAGKMLLTTLREYCVQHGIKEIFVAAHAADKHALDFYRSAGGVGEEVVHFSFL